MSNIQTAEEKGRKLGILIASLNITDREREDILSLLPHMSEQQLEDFILTLEKNYLQAMTEDYDKKLLKDLEKADAKFQAKLSKIQADTNTALDALV